jgi:hypothetical protein
MSKTPAAQPRKSSHLGKEASAENQETMQPERKISRANMAADTQQGQSEADRLQAAEENKH